MIKVIVGFRVKVGADIQPALLKLRSYAITFPGFVSAENLVRIDDNTIIAIEYKWDSIENWENWENTKIRKQILKEMEGLLREEPRIKIYNVVPSVGWAYTHMK